MKVLIATPTTQGSVATAYAHTLVAATSALHEAKAGHRLMIVDGADVVLARTILAHAFLADASLTHILFLDSDMGVEPKVLRHLIGLGAPIVGVAYPERKMDLPALAAALREDGDIERARALASGFTVRMSAGRKEVRQGIVEAEGFGFGCVLIARSVFEALIARGIAKPMVSAKLRAAGLQGEIFDFFRQIAREDGDLLSEDYSFCERVRALGDTQLLCFVGGGVVHVGQFPYSAAFVERLKAGKG